MLKFDTGSEDGNEIDLHAYGAYHFDLFGPGSGLSLRPTLNRSTGSGVGSARCSPFGAPCFDFLWHGTGAAE